MHFKQLDFLSKYEFGKSLKIDIKFDVYCYIEMMMFNYFILNKIDMQRHMFHILSKKEIKSNEAINSKIAMSLIDLKNNEQDFITLDHATINSLFAFLDDYFIKKGVEITIQAPDINTIN